MHDFTPISAAVGGGLIGLAASLLLLASGRVAGISGILGGLLFTTRGDRLWRVLFLLGLIAAGAVAAALAPHSIAASPRSLPTVAGAGLLVGIGTTLGNGCTSGHGVCGVSRLSPGPALTALFGGGMSALIFVATMLLGIYATAKFPSLARSRHVPAKATAASARMHAAEP